MNTPTSQSIDLSQRLFIELGTDLLIEGKDKNRSLSSKLIGMKVGNYLIVNISAAKPEMPSWLEKEQVLVKYVNQDDIFSFKSRILTILDQPDALMFLKYPDHVKNCNIRRHKRVECFLPIHAKSRNRRDSGVVINISAQGCLCMIDQFESWENITGETIELSFSYGNQETLSINGKVRSNQIQSSQIKLGIQFDDIDNFSQWVLSTLVPSLRL